MSTPIAISRVHFPVTTLGPGRRLGIWLQGCSIRCPGCISMDTWNPGHGVTTVARVLDAVAAYAAEAEGITLSGGEPFDQTDALIDLLGGLRRLSRADVLVFTGYAREAIQPALDRAAGLIDALISDPFDRTKPQSLALRGSDNQRLHFFTPRGRERFADFERPANAADRTFDVMLDDDGTAWLAGIPARDDFRKLRVLLEADGHRLGTSEDVRSHAIPSAAPPR